MSASTALASPRIGRLTRQSFGAMTRPERARIMAMLVTFVQQAQPQRVPDLVDQLQVRRDAGPAIQVELNHQASIYLDT
jgi:hypothetical protein